MCSPEESGQDDDMSENLRKAKEDINLEVTPRGGAVGWCMLSSSERLPGGAGPALPAAPPSVPGLSPADMDPSELIRPSWGCLNLYDGQLYVPT